jgi:glycine/D-amino acid oxidase-like deaminating enzyme
MTQNRKVDIAIVGAGIAGIATAYFLVTRFAKSSMLLIDSRPPMSYTSAQSGDNYRNWWPHPTMAAFTTRSIDLLEGLARETDNVFNLTRRGYVLATRDSASDELIENLTPGYVGNNAPQIRIHDTSSAGSYTASLTGDWQSAPDGVDVLTDRALIHRTFPALTEDIASVVHIRRAGDLDSQQLATFMLGRIREAGARVVRGEVRSVTAGNGFELELETPDGRRKMAADVFVNAAGPMAGQLAKMLNADLPIRNVFQQKVAFEDVLALVPRDMPFTIDIDDTRLEWADDIRNLLAEDPETRWLTGTLPGGRHCRPDGGPRGRWVKLGWAYNTAASEPQQDLANESRLDRQFPEIVIRGAAAMIPALASYIDKPPARFSHYGGYYTMTEENWPLIGPLGVDGAFTVSALSGFGSMAACAAGADCAAWVSGGELPDYAGDLSLARYSDKDRMEALWASADKGLL